MTRPEYRDTLARLGYTQSGLARTMIEMGDPRSFNTVLRAISAQSSGESKVSGEMCVILTLLERQAPAPLEPRQTIDRRSPAQPAAR